MAQNKGRNIQEKQNLADVYEEATQIFESSLPLNFYKNGYFRPIIDSEEFKLLNQYDGPEEKTEHLSFLLKSLDNADDKINLTRNLLFPRKIENLNGHTNGVTNGQSNTTKKSTALPYITEAMSDVYMQKSYLQSKLFKKHREHYTQISTSERNHTLLNDTIFNIPPTLKANNGDFLPFSPFEIFKRDFNNQNDDLSTYASKLIPRDYKTLSLKEYSDLSLNEDNKRRKEKKLINSGSTKSSLNNKTQPSHLTSSKSSLNKKDTHSDEDDPRRRKSDFKTARCVLLENSKKQRSNSDLNSQRKEESYNRLNKPFVNPVIKKDKAIYIDDLDDNQNDYSQNNYESKKKKKKSNNDTFEDNEIDDERLKNIEPAMVERITNEIMSHTLSLDWDDIAGLNHAKALIKEIVVWPMLRPDIFKGLLGPPKGLLLFGPPGTGKTLIGKCIASQSNATFFSISSSSLTSKWIGDGEKMVRALFAVARCHQPSVIFVDEIDSLLTQRTDGEVEASRRIKTEFLVQLDGCATSEEDRVLVIGATNRPQEIDEAARRRFRKRVYIPLPELEGRKKIIQNLINKQNHDISESDIDKIAELTKGYSGSDMDGLCREAALGPIRSIHCIATATLDEVRPINLDDFLLALKQVRASVDPKEMDFYINWNEKFGSLN